MQSPVGDLLNAWKRLGIEDAQTRAQVAALLGFGGRATSESKSGIVEPPEREARRREIPPFAPRRSQPTETRRFIDVHTLSNLVEATQDRVLHSDTMETVSGLPPLPRKTPLLNPLWQRGIFTALLSIPLETRELDTRAVLDTLSQGKEVDRIPWRTVPSLSLGVRCFVDASVAMHPFLEDQSQLIASLRRTFGQDRVAIGYFELLPDSPGVRFPDETKHAASPYAPLLIVSDFGATATPGRRWALPEEWVDYLRRERQKGASGIFALSPLGRGGVPRAIRNDVVVLEWDRTISVRSVLRERARRVTL